MSAERRVTNILTGYIGEGKVHKMLTTVLTQNKEYFKNMDKEDPTSVARNAEVKREIVELEEYINDRFGLEF